MSPSLNDGLPEKPRQASSAAGWGCIVGHSGTELILFVAILGITLDVQPRLFESLSRTGLGLRTLQVLATMGVQPRKVTGSSPRGSTIARPLADAIETLTTLYSRWSMVSQETYRTMWESHIP